ncbi:MAG: tetratricopeptide repeat protein [Alphaproteobacteria bacterium]|nr:tetratricopeptide repeat protein [Alphaproteobacteria bacterium]
MKRFLFSLVAMLGVVLAVNLAEAKDRPKAKPKPGQLTTADLSTCMGLNNATPRDQVPACTKIINSGDVKHPHLGDYYATRGGAYFALKQFDKALADLDKALSIRKAPEFYFQRALVRLARNENEPAKADLAEVIKLKPEFSASYMMRGLIAYRAGEYAEAVTYFDSAVKRVPTYYQAIFARGVSKKKSGDDSGGDADLKTARGMRSGVDKDLEKLGVTP